MHPADSKSHPKHRLAVIVCLATMLVAPIASTADVVTEWNTAALNAIRAIRENPPRASRAMAITHLSIYDAANGVQRTHRSYHVTDPAPGGASLEAAIAAAGYTALNSLFTNPDVQQTNFLALYTAQLAAIPDGQAKTDGIAWGQSVAQAMLALRANDGWNAVVPYTPSGELGRWEPTPPANAPALLPGWGSVTPFSMNSGAQFRPQGPPPIDSSAYSFEFNTVKQYGGATGSIRTADQSEIAQFWNDGAGTATPPGHWNEIAQTISGSEGLSVLENARLFALLNLATADAAICSWDAKFAYDYWRPVTAVRKADLDGNPETDPDPAWISFITTPPFPEYTSGHSTFSRSSATVLSGYFGTDDISFATTSDGTPGVVRNFTKISVAADEAGISRIYGGIHWPSANIQAQACGWGLARQILAYYLRPLSSLQFSQVSRASGNTLLELHAEAFTTYAIRASSDLNTWETIAIISSGDGILRFTDVNAGSLQKRFYQAVEQ